MLKIWHRWACGYEVENTLASFAKAIDLWVDMIEIDVRLCASGELVVAHDRDLYRVLDIELDIYTSTLEEIQKHKLANGETIARLEDTLDLINHRCRVNIEIKHISVVEPLLKLLDYYVAEKWWTWDDFLLSSFDHYAIQLVKKLNANIHTWALMDGIMIWYAKFAEDLWCDSIHPNIDFASQELVDDAHDRWLAVYVYTCNTSLQIARAWELWVDGIISDYPDRIGLD